MTVKQQAIEGIKDDLWQHSRCFIAFRKNLNPIMKRMVINYIKLQEKLNGKTKV